MHVSECRTQTKQQLQRIVALFCFEQSKGKVNQLKINMIAYISMQEKYIVFHVSNTRSLWKPKSTFYDYTCYCGVLSKKAYSTEQHEFEG